MNDPKDLIPKPCSEDWNQMSGDERSRFCDKCSTQIHNLDGLTSQQILDLQKKNGGNLCGKLSKRFVLGASISSLALASCSTPVEKTEPCLLGVIAPPSKVPEKDPFPENEESTQKQTPKPPAREYPRPILIGKVMLKPTEEG